MTSWRRHRWVKVRPHVYICQQCGCGKVNAQTPGGEWVTTFHRPDGTSAVSRHVPPCETGARTRAYLDHHTSAIACAPPSERRSHL